MSCVLIIVISTSPIFEIKSNDLLILLCNISTKSSDTITSQNSFITKLSSTNAQKKYDEVIKIVKFSKTVPKVERKDTLCSHRGYKFQNYQKQL
jgi:hypothetical protein